MALSIPALLSKPEVQEDVELCRLLDVFHLYQNNPDYLGDAAYALGIRGYVDEAITLSKRRLRKTPSNLAIHIDLAVMYGQKGDSTKRLEHFEKIPPRFQHGTAYGNLLSDLGYRDKAMACYEQHCRSGDPPFYLSFLTLAGMYDESADERRYWLEQGLKKLPGQIRLVYNLAIAHLSAGEFDKVASLEPESLDIREDLSVIRGSGPDNLQLQTRLFLLKNLFLSIEAGLEKEILESLSVLPEIQRNHGCQPLKALFNPLSESGSLIAVSKIHQMLCDSCGQDISKPDLLVRTAIYTEKESILRATFEDNESSLSPITVIRYASALDDRGHYNESLDLFKKYNFFSEQSPAIQFAARCDGMIYGLKLGNYVLASELANELCNYDRNEVLSWYSSSWDGRTTVPEGYFDDQLGWRWANSFLASVALGNLDEARSKLTNLRSQPKNVDGTHAYALPDGSLVEADWCDRFEEVLQWASVRVGSSSYQTEFAKFFEINATRFGNSEVGVLHPEATSPSVSFLDFLSGKNKLSALTDWRFQAKVNEQKGDVSHLETSLRSYIPSFSILASGARDSLINAERRFLDSELGFDDSATIHSYCKALEIDLRERFFFGMRDFVKKHRDFSTLLENAQLAKNVAQFTSILKFLNGGFIELGVMGRCLRLVQGKTAKKVELFAKVHQFFSTNAPFLLAEDFVGALENVVEDYRNPSSHDTGMTYESASEVRQKVGDLLNLMTRMRLITV